mmetsp:Transcript_15277/g.41854  ORF Transcript_15277/g.41854 Transcript_15277/m.41854 type:complete len:593 (-) Transcript_15277:150-1928(-)
MRHGSDEAFMDTYSSDFFWSLPPDELTPPELKLRQALLDWVRELPRPLPIVEWIDRRIGGELETRSDTLGSVEVALRGVGFSTKSVETSPETFFEKLPKDFLSTSEELLRDGIFEFLACWKSSELATLADLAGHPVVQQRQAAFLPQEVQLKDWVERRIGLEVHFSRDAKGRFVLELSPAARGHVRVKFEQLRVEGRHRLVGESEQREISRESFFSNLPLDELLPLEIDLRQSLLDFMQRWRQQHQRPEGQPTPSPPLSSAARDTTIVRLRSALLPPKVSFKDWVEHRIGREVELRLDAHGRQYELALVPGTLAAVTAVPGAGGGASGSATADTSAGVLGRAVSASDSFLNSLPPEEITELESNLRTALLGFLMASGDIPVLVTEAMKDEGILVCQKAFLPPDVPLVAWIESRVGGEVEVFKSSTGVITMKTQIVPAAGDAKVEKKNQPFFETLPTDEFTLEEEWLRKAVLGFLSSWDKPERATLSNALKSVHVELAWKALLGNHTPVPFQDWIDRRIGGEVEMRRTAGDQWELALSGSFDDGDAGGDGVCNRGGASSGNAAGFGTGTASTTADGVSFGSGKRRKLCRVEGN